MYKLIMVFVLASTLGADLSHLLEQLSQGERGDDLFYFQSPSLSGFYLYAFVLSWAHSIKTIMLCYHCHSLSELTTKYFVMMRTSWFSDD